MHRHALPFDAPFFGKVLFGGLLAACVGCFGVAASAMTPATPDAGIVSVTALLAATPRPAAEAAPAKIRVGIMTERVRGDSAARIARADR